MRFQRDEHEKSAGRENARRSFCVLRVAAVAVNSASPRSNAELEQAYLAELNRPEEEELFAEIERDWYENEEKPAGKEKEGDDFWEGERKIKK